MTPQLTVEIALLGHRERLLARPLPFYCQTELNINSNNVLRVWVTCGQSVALSMRYPCPNPNPSAVIGNLLIRAGEALPRNAGGGAHPPGAARPLLPGLHPHTTTTSFSFSFGCGFLGLNGIRRWRWHWAHFRRREI